jgi:hypothetical protein
MKSSHLDHLLDMVAKFEQDRRHELGGKKDKGKKKKKKKPSKGRNQPQIP